MKAIKSFFVFILIFIGVKACSFVSSTLLLASSAGDAYSSASTPAITVQGSYPAEGEIAGYERAYFANNISLAYPTDWHILSKAEVANVRSIAESIQGEYKDHKDTVLTAVAHQDPFISTAQLRVSFQAKGFTQQVLSGATREDLDLVCSGYISVVSNPNLPSQLIGTPTCEKVMLGDKFAISIKYDRTGAANTGSASVTMFQIPLDDSIGLITITHKIDSAAGKTAVENIINSIKIS